MKDKECLCKDRGVIEMIEDAVREERERIVKSLDWRNCTDGTQFHDGGDVVDWYDKKLQSLTPTKTDKQDYKE